MRGGVIAEVDLSRAAAADSQTPDGGRLTGGELNSAVTSALIGIYAQFTGRGPERAFTFHHGNVLVTVMRGVLTPAGRSLARRGATDLLDEVRRGIRTTMEADFRLAVERLTGEPVLAFLGGNSIEPDVSAEVFLLGGSL